MRSRMCFGTCFDSTWDSDGPQSPVRAADERLPAWLRSSVGSLPTSATSPNTVRQMVELGDRCTVHRRTANPKECYAAEQSFALSFQNIGIPTGGAAWHAQLLHTAALWRMPQTEPVSWISATDPCMEGIAHALRACNSDFCVHSCGNRRSGLCIHCMLCGKCRPGTRAVTPTPAPQGGATAHLPRQLEHQPARGPQPYQLGSRRGGPLSSPPPPTTPLHCCSRRWTPSASGFGTAC
jgi:hypothetical protein